MRTINFTDFRRRASELLTAVEQGETLTVIRHGRPVAEVTPIPSTQPAWKRPALRLATTGHDLAAAIIEEREA